MESVWDYPRPPRVEPAGRRIRVVLGGTTIAETTRALRVLETSHPPTYYVPREDVAAGVLVESPGATSHCEWKGRAAYFDVVAGDRREAAAAWSYPDPSPGYEAIRGAVAFYPARMDACFVGDEAATPQPGGFYGGWVTADVSGPFKGAPGTSGW
jgi:uncharacterized protein (DUF427 family)